MSYRNSNGRYSNRHSRDQTPPYREEPMRYEERHYGRDNGSNYRRDNNYHYESDNDHHYRRDNGSIHRRDNNYHYERDNDHHYRRDNGSNYRRDNNYHYERDNYRRNDYRDDYERGYDHGRDSNQRRYDAGYYDNRDDWRPHDVDHYYTDERRGGYEQDPRYDRREYPNARQEHTDYHYRIHENQANYRNINEREHQPHKFDQRAPKDWVPEVHDEEEMAEALSKRAQQLRIEDDEELEIRNSDVTKKLTSWEDANFHPTLLANLKDCGYNNVRPVQALVIPQVMKGYDVVAQAETGGGKTAAYALPIINKILEIPESVLKDVNNQVSPYCLILVPTRELAKQVWETIRVYVKGSPVKAKVAYGEWSLDQNIDHISGGCHILVGTCGRTLHFIQTGEITFNNLRFLVLDEADILAHELAKNESHIKTIFKTKYFRDTQASRQTLFFSATLDATLEKAVSTLMKPVEGFAQSVRVVLAGARLNPRVHLNFVETETMRDKYVALEKFVTKSSTGEFPKTLVFVDTINRAKFIALQMVRSKVEAKAICRIFNQEERETILEDFRQGKVTTLVVSDLCCRGLDIPDLDRVVLFEIAVSSSVERTIDNFIHRVGRTGRFRRGDAYVFINKANKTHCELIPAFVELVKSSKKEYTLPKFMLEYVNPMNGQRPLIPKEQNQSTISLRQDNANRTTEETRFILSQEDKIEQRAPHEDEPGPSNSQGDYSEEHLHQWLQNSFPHGSGVLQSGGNTQKRENEEDEW